MSANSRPTSALVMGDDPEPNYNWFGNFDYSWFDDSGSLSSVPYFEAVSEQLDTMIEASSTQRQLRLGFESSDCITVSGTRNCTEACSNPSSLFTPTNLRACTALAGAALLVQNNTYSVDRSDAPTAEAIDSWQIPDLSAYNATGVFASVAECIVESCAVSKLGKCADGVRNLGGVEIKVDDLQTFSSQLQHFCDGTDPRINADIAGPGVLVSYFLQTSLALLFYLLLKISTVWVRRLHGLFSCCSGRGDTTKQDSRLRSGLAILRTKLADSKLGAAVPSSLVEFQEVQAYYIASVQIATLMSYNPELTDTAGVNNDSYAAVILNSGLAALLNINSVTCILLVQCCLQRARMRWWYTFIITTFTSALALAIFARRSSLMPPVEGLWEKFKSDAPLPLCGNNPSPMTYCKPPRDTRFLDNDIAGYSICSFGALIWVGLLSDQLAFTARERFPTLAKRLRNLDRGGILRRESKLWGYASAAYWFFVELILFGGVVYHMNVLVLIVGDVSIGDAAKWGFGQLIAVAVWAPIVAKFIYFNIFGVKGGFEERIAKSYTIKREDETKGRNDILPGSGRNLSHATTYPLVGDKTTDSASRFSFTRREI
ncbi:hypothetical protein FQN50_004076 [Emmonsiellopsis sp. PD_5]|nr:hypothetical protein FQN50_004076 [Emmonsiellopsis sp. PD_5]